MQTATDMVHPASSQSSGDPILVARNIRKTFGATIALDNVDFELARGSIHALLGGNGAGKSTLIKVFAGVQPADSGELCLAGKVLTAASVRPGSVKDLGLRFVHQQNATFPSLSILENLALGAGFAKGLGGRIDWRAQKRIARDLLERFGIDADPDTRVEDISAAKKKLVEIARALQDLEGTKDAVLVLDEPTASLPTNEVDQLLDAVRSYSAAGQSIIYVTHRLEEVFAIADTATILRNGRRVAQLEVRKITSDDLIEQMMGETVSLARKANIRPAGKTVFEAKDLQIEHLQPISLSLKSGEVVGIAGLIGSGRTRFLKGLFGHYRRVSGTMSLEGREITPRSISEAMAAGIAYIPEDRIADAMFPTLTVSENSAVSDYAPFWNGAWLKRSAQKSEMQDLIKNFMIKTAGPDAQITSLSGGNQQKVVLARWMRRKPKILLLDEPTQGVDVRARAEIYQLIDKAVAEGATTLMASSDFEELVSVCDRVLIFKDGSLTHEFAGPDVTLENINRSANA